MSPAPHRSFPPQRLNRPGARNSRLPPDSGLGAAEPSALVCARLQHDGRSRVGMVSRRRRRGPRASGPPVPRGLPRPSGRLAKLGAGPSDAGFDQSGRGRLPSATGESGTQEDGDGSGKSRADTMVDNGLSLGVEDGCAEEMTYVEIRVRSRADMSRKNAYL
ncbi:hypothetical protein BDV95DRAFT_588912 [Massariosphaeria phaeospora]|uniref:Uncharacterized protein n=1 Tax=Massariosphaeria phaeospora TaxID=100035 RepID=A0A7C8MDM5_9PLEO|nr:hypothetical protein BDV95DRAFT_588912 [Massariosphaeria phaeospora]